MKKIIATVCVLVCFWMMFSFLDVVSDNKSENPKHSDLNFFVLITPEEEEETEPAVLREVWAEVTAINQEAESITLLKCTRSAMKLWLCSMRWEQMTGTMMKSWTW